jgi:uncharacterized protein (TIGR02246 family)
MAVDEPAAILAAFTEAFNRRDLNALVELYETGATLVPEPGRVVVGVEAIRQALSDTLARHITIAVMSRAVVQANELALLQADWTLDRIGPDGALVMLARSSTSVVREQAGGNWRYVIDNPYGAAAF